MPRQNPDAVPGARAAEPLQVVPLVEVVALPIHGREVGSVRLDQAADAPLHDQPGVIPVPDPGVLNPGAQALAGEGQIAEGDLTVAGLVKVVELQPVEHPVDHVVPLDRVETPDEVLAAGPRLTPLAQLPEQDGRRVRGLRALIVREQVRRQPRHSASQQPRHGDAGALGDLGEDVASLEHGGEEQRVVLPAVADEQDLRLFQTALRFQKQLRRRDGLELREVELAEVAVAPDQLPRDEPTRELLLFEREQILPRPGPIEVGPRVRRAGEHALMRALVLVRRDQWPLAGAQQHGAPRLPPPGLAAGLVAPGLGPVRDDIRDLCEEAGVCRLVLVLVVHPHGQVLRGAEARPEVGSAVIPCEHPARLNLWHRPRRRPPEDGERHGEDGCLARLLRAVQVPGESRPAEQLQQGGGGACEQRARHDRHPGRRSHEVAPVLEVTVSDPIRAHQRGRLAVLVLGVGNLPGLRRARVLQPGRAEREGAPVPAESSDQRSARDLGLVRSDERAEVRSESALVQRVDVEPRVSEQRDLVRVREVAAGHPARDLHAVLIPGDLPVNVPSVEILSGLDDHRNLSAEDAPLEVAGFRVLALDVEVPVLDAVAGWDLERRVRGSDRGRDLIALRILRQHAIAPRVAHVAALREIDDLAGRRVVAGDVQSNPRLRLRERLLDQPRVAVARLIIVCADEHETVRRELLPVLGQPGPSPDPNDAEIGQKTPGRARGHEVGLALDDQQPLRTGRLPLKPDDHIRRRHHEAAGRARDRRDFRGRVLLPGRALFLREARLVQLRRDAAQPDPPLLPIEIDDHDADLIAARDLGQVPPREPAVGLALLVPVGEPVMQPGRALEVPREGPEPAPEGGAIEATGREPRPHVFEPLLARELVPPLALGTRGADLVRRRRRRCVRVVLLWSHGWRRWLNGRFRFLSTLACTLTRSGVSLSLPELRPGVAGVRIPEAAGVEPGANLAPSGVACPGRVRVVAQVAADVLEGTAALLARRPVAVRVAALRGAPAVDQERGGSPVVAPALPAALDRALNPGPGREKVDPPRHVHDRHAVEALDPALRF